MYTKGSNYARLNIEILDNIWEVCGFKSGLGVIMFLSKFTVTYLLGLSQKNGPGKNDLAGLILDKNLV